MAMSLGPSSGGDEPEVMTEINTTPLIDVMLVLLIMLIITIPIQTHAVKMDMPAGPPPAAAKPPEVVRVEIDAEGRIRWNGQVLDGRSELEANLRRLAAQADQPELHLKPDLKTAYRHVAMVMASAQHLGVTKVGIIGAERFME